MKKFNKKGVSFNDLPKTRKQQFFFIFKLNFTTILRIGFWFTLCCLPLIACYILKNVYAGKLVSDLISSGASNTTIQFNVLIVDLIFSATNFITFIPLGIGFSFTYRLYRNLIFDCGLLFKEDCLKGIRVNFKNNYLSLIFINIFLIFFFFIKFAIRISLDTTLSSLFCGLLFGVFDLLVICSLTSFELNTLYIIKVPGVFKTSFVFLIRGILISLIYLVIFSGFRLLVANISIYITIGLVVLGTFLVIPLLILIHFLYSYSLFDVSLNKKYPEYQYKGLYKE